MGHRDKRPFVSFGFSGTSELLPLQSTMGDKGKGPGKKIVKRKREIAKKEVSFSDYCKTLVVNILITG